MKPLVVVALCVIGMGCSQSDFSSSASSAQNAVATTGTSDPRDLPPPHATPSAVKFPSVIGWPDGRTPTAAAGLKVTRFAGGLAHPRWLYVLPNGDVLVAEANTTPPRNLPPDVVKGLEKANSVGESANRVTMLRDADRDGVAEERSVFVSGLRQPFGMLLLGDSFYVANTDSVMRYRYEQGQPKIADAGRKILDLPAGGYNNHWTRNIIASPDGSRLYVSVGSATNVDEEGIDAKDPRRAAILEVKPDGTSMRIFASGLRNPNGMDWAPGTNDLWVAVNERDELGDDLVPDYLTRVRENAFYGWPYSYFGPHEDPRHKGERPDLVGKAVAPDYPLGAHTASLGLVFYRGNAFPERYRNGAFVAQHGSWNRSRFSGYRVAFIPFANGRPSGPMEDFLTGFIANEQSSEVFGRPVGLAVLPDGSLLVADDAANTIWRVGR